MTNAHLRIHRRRRGWPARLRRSLPAWTLGRMRELQIVDAAELACAYAAAVYVVVLDGDSIPLRVGEAAIDLEAYAPASRYAFITAWNPASQPRSDTANEAADALLVAQLDALGAARHAAWAQGPAGRWRGPGWVVADLDESMLLRLAQEFGQAGVLDWAAGEPVRLRMLAARPAGEAVAHTDWIIA